MQDQTTQAHWDEVYDARGATGVSWFEPAPKVSLSLLEAAGLGPGSRAIDVGGGASRLVDALLERGVQAPTVLDLSDHALALARARLGPRAAEVDWVVGDVLDYRPTRAFDLWHDRAVFHFLTQPADQARYVERLAAALRPGGQAVIATFAPDGPERCSGLAVARHDAASLTCVLGPRFELLEALQSPHTTPDGRVQPLQYCRFRKRP